MLRMKSDCPTVFRSVHVVHYKMTVLITALSRRFLLFRSTWSRSISAPGDPGFWKAAGQKIGKETPTTPGVQYGLKASLPEPLHDRHQMSGTDSKAQDRNTENSDISFLQP